MEDKITIEITEGVTVSFPLKERYTAPEFIAFASNLSKGINAFYERLENNSETTVRKKRSKIDLIAIQNDIDKTKMSYFDISKKYGLGKNTFQYHFRVGNLKRRKNYGKY